METTTKVKVCGPLLLACLQLLLEQAYQAEYRRKLRLAERIVGEKLELPPQATNRLPALVRQWRSTEGLDLVVDYKLHPMRYWPYQVLRVQDCCPLVKRNGRYERATRAPSRAYKTYSLDTLAEEEYLQEEQDYQI